ncbi:MAG: FAD:protein FMN transferase [Acidimicrobiales bacterium]
MSATAVGVGRRSRLGVYRSAVWSTRVDLVVTDPHKVVAATELLQVVLARVEAVASRFRPDSEVNVLHAAAGSGRPVPVSADLLDSVTIALRAARLTDGAVDPTVGASMCRIGYDRDFSAVMQGVPGDLPEPGPVAGWRSVSVDAGRSTVALPAGVVLDLGATAKAWAADLAATSIASHLHCGVLVSLGGDVAVCGSAPEGGFSIGIADVCGDAEAPVTVAVASGGLATSGIGKRHWTVGGLPVHHLIDPSTGLPVDSPWKTVSVAAASCVDANTASTAAMVMGRSAVSWLGEQRLPSRLVGLDGTTVAVAGWPDETTDAARTGGRPSPSLGSRR